MSRQQRAGELRIGARVMCGGVERVVGSIRWQGAGRGTVSVQFTDTRSRVSYEPAEIVIVLDEAA